MDALEALRTRRSVRKFADRKVEKKLIETMVDCGRLAATARNEQPWEFVAVTDAAAVKEIGNMTDHGKFIADAPACIAVFCKDGKYFIEDGSAATQNILVAARALGLGTCWVAGDKNPYAGKAGEALGVPADRKLVALIAVGYPLEEPKMPQKRPLADVLHWEKF